jgi:iron complex outermembrane recepter protein
VSTRPKRLFDFATLCIAVGLFMVTGEFAHAEGLSRPLPAQPLTDALMIVAKEFDLMLIYQAELSAGVPTRGAPAGLSVEDTLRALLKDTSLTWELIEGRALMIRPRNSAHVQRDDEPTDSAELVRESVLRPVAGQAKSVAQVLITGRHMPNGILPIGAQQITVTRDAIQRNGYATVADVMRSLPQNFPGGPSEDTWTIGQEEIYNSSRGTGANLRGLGPGSTLVLVNGRRLAAGGGDGRFVDISGIPLSAIQRIDVFPDGASAIYGADAVGGVVNIELLPNYAGAETLVRLGQATAGSPHEYQLAQTLGRTWASGSALLSAEFYRRSELPAADRLQSRSSDLTPLGGNNFDIAEGNPGTIISGSETWAIPPHQDGQTLTSGDLTAGRPNLHNRNEGMDLLPDHRRWGLIGRLNQKVGDLDLFADLLLSKRDSEIALGPMRLTFAVPNTNAFYVSPTGGNDPVSIAYGFGPDLGIEVDTARVTTSSVTAGLNLRAGEWTITPAISYASARDLIDRGPLVDQEALSRALADPDPATAFNPFGDGSFTAPETLERLRVDVLRKTQTILHTAGIDAGGSLGRWFDRDVKMAAGLETRHEALASLGTQGDIRTIDSRRNRFVNAGYAEVVVPIIDAHHKRIGAHSLSLSVGSRYEHYSDAGGARMPRVGLDWSPVSQVNLRSTWSKSFKAPKLVELDDSRSFNALSSQADRSASSGFSQVLLSFGSNAELRDETARVWTLGADMGSSSRGLGFGLTYFDIDYRDRIDRIDFTSSILDDPALSDLVIRNPSYDERRLVCDRARFIGNPNDCLVASVSAMIDMRLGNIASMKTSGLDVSIHYDADSELGQFEAGIAATYIFDFLKSRYYTEPIQSVLDTPGNPLRLRGRAHVFWDRGPLSVSAALNYAGSYVDTASKPHRSVRPWTTIDMAVRFQLTSYIGSRLDGIFIDLSAQNLFNEPPPFLNNPIGLGYDPENADLVQRFVSLGLRKEW